MSMIKSNAIRILLQQLRSVFPSTLQTTVLCNDSFLKWKKINSTNLKKNQLSNGKEMDYHWLHPACVRDDGWPQSWHW
jgi:hypothetical protein